MATNAANSDVYDIIYHHDVWGNAEDGWQVSDSGKLNRRLVVQSGQGIFEALREMGLWAKGTEEGDIDIYDFGDSIAIDDANDGRPLCYLIPVEVDDSTGQKGE